MAKPAKIKSYEDLIVWQKAMDALDIVLDLTDTPPLSKKFWLCNQIGASAASVPANIAEGHDNGTLKVYLKHLYYSRGSLGETRTYVTAIGRRKYAERTKLVQLWKLYREVGRLLNGLIDAIERKLGIQPDAEPFPET